MYGSAVLRETEVKWCQHHPWNPMASWCEKCGQQDPRYLPYTSIRITEAEMRAYHHFLGSCIRLEYMAKKGTVRAIMSFFYVCFVIRPPQWNNSLTDFTLKFFTLQCCLKFTKEFKKDFLNKTLISY